MNDAESGARRLVILVEDDAGVVEQVRRRLSRYPIDCTAARDGGEALALLGADLGSRRPDALVLDLMLPYGAARGELDGDSDPDEAATGMRLLARLRHQESTASTDHLWVAIITARSPFAVDARAKELFAGHGCVYYKPFDPLRIEDDLVRALGLPSLVLPALLGVTEEGDEEQS